MEVLFDAMYALSDPLIVKSRAWSRALRIET